jgi:hypothetical protein
MVTPSYKNGQPLIVEGYAPDGESLLLTSPAALAGAVGSAEVISQAGVYLDRRTPAGWQLSALNAPLSEFVGEFPVAAEPVSGLTLWKQHTPGQPAREVGIYVRSPAGIYSYIGRLNPLTYPQEEPSDTQTNSETEVDVLKAATSDYEHLVLEAQRVGGRWPFDETPVGENSHSLYEYSGTDNSEPVLVGVTGGKGSRQLVGGCGTELGSGGSGSHFNSISGDGEAIFFSVMPCGSAPATVEVYARLHGALTSAAPAVTVDVSASECTVGCGPGSGKNFEGASEDGRLVFFTSTQKLTSEAVDGTAGGDAFLNGCAGMAPAENGEGGCNLYLYDFSAPEGERLHAVSTGGEVLGVIGMAADGTRAYYVSRAENASAGSNVYGKPSVAGQPNLYVYDTTSKKSKFIGTLSESDAADWKRFFSRPAEVAGETGRFLLFSSSEPNLTPDDTSALTQLFEYRAPGEGEDRGGGSETAELVRVTKGENGYNQDGNAISEPPGSETVSESIAESLAKSIRGGALPSDFKSRVNGSDVSPDGRMVFFQTVGQLSPGTTAAAVDCTSVYEFHTEGPLSQGAVHLLSDGRDTQLYKGISCGAKLLGTDRTGANVLIRTGDPLLPSDVNGVQQDLYDVRVDGGLDLTPGGGSCGPGACERPSSTPPTLPVAGSTTPSSQTPPTSTNPKTTSRKKHPSHKRSPRKKRHNTRRDRHVTARP